MIFARTSLLARALALPALLAAVPPASAPPAPPLSPAPVAATAELAIDGSVADLSEAPIAGAAVELRPILPEGEVERLLLSGKDEIAPVATARTDAAGRFRLAAPAAGMWSLEVKAAGRGTMQRELAPIFEAVSLERVYLGPAAPRTVRVVDPAGKPVPFAIVDAAPSWDRPSALYLRNSFLWRPPACAR
jgi:hypothetical protein